MTERIFGPFKESFDDALSRLNAAVAKSQSEAEVTRITVGKLLNGIHASAAEDTYLRPVSALPPAR